MEKVIGPCFQSLPIAGSEWWKGWQPLRKDSYANAPSNLLIIIQAALVLRPASTPLQVFGSGRHEKFVTMFSLFVSLSLKFFCSLVVRRATVETISAARWKMCASFCTSPAKKRTHFKVWIMFAVGVLGNIRRFHKLITSRNLRPDETARRKLCSEHCAVNNETLSITQQTSEPHSLDETWCIILLRACIIRANPCVVC